MSDNLELSHMMREMGEAARAAARQLAKTPRAPKDDALRAAAKEMRASESRILSANAQDMALGREKGLSAAMLDRLLLTPERIESMAAGLEAIAALADPVGQEIAAWERPNGLKISRIRTALGVIGVIYESRPNVTADAGALCLKAGNAVILRGGSESYHSARAIHAALVAGLEAAGLPKTAIQMVPTTDRSAVGEMLRMTPYIDVIVPRGGKGLVGRVQSEARVPVFAHLEGICHIYVDAAADPAKARAVVLNAKMRRTGICGAAECLLIHQSAWNTGLGPAIIEDLLGAGVEVRGDAVIAQMKGVTPATEADWGCEYLDSIIAARLVPDLDCALGHIARYSSSHTDAILTEDAGAVQRFTHEVDSAIVMHNASTQFADGGEFGMGAEIGIATGKLHARGPVGVEQLTSFKYIVRGNGTLRP